MENESEPAKKAIPKFGSFRPWSQHNEEPIKEERHTNTRKPSLPRNHPSHPDSSEKDVAWRVDHRSHGSHHHRSRRLERRQNEKEKERNVRLISPRPVIVPWNESSNLYQVDRRGDVGNLAYGALHSYSIPSYFCVGAGSIIGVPPHTKIDRHNSHEKAVVLRSDSGHSILKREKALFTSKKATKLRELRIKPGISRSFNSAGEGSDFIALRPSSDKTRESAKDEILVPQDSSEEGDVHYRSIEGKAKLINRPVDSDLQFASDEISSEDETGLTLELERALRQKSLNLSRWVDSEPQNVNAWLDLIKHQEELLTFSRNSDSARITTAERVSTADIKLSMYEKALGKVVESQPRERLLLGMMEEGSKIWETQKVLDKWRSVLRSNPCHVSLWTKYLDFHQTNFSMFRLDEVKEIYTECLKHLKEAQLKDGISTADSRVLVNAQIYVILRLTLFLREAGFSEFATAVWQALLEYTFHRPSQFIDGDVTNNPSLKEIRLKSFEDFWESEVPRIGEHGSQGWDSFTNQPEHLPAAKRDGGQVSVLGAPENALFLGWLESEYTQASQARAPARTTDEAEEYDPYRVILFFDIRDTLVDCPLPPERGNLLCAFLHFCQLPPLHSSERFSKSSAWWKDSFVRNELEMDLEHHQLFRSSSLSRLQPFTPSKALQNEPGTENPVTDHPLDFPLPFHAISLDSLFASNHLWVSAFRATPTDSKSAQSHVPVDWVHQALRSLVTKDIGGEELAEYFLAFECRSYPNDVKKTAKLLLKRKPSSLRLYNAYSLTEYYKGNTETANTIVTTAINMSNSFEESIQYDAIYLWRTWIWQSLKAGDLMQALHRLFLIPNKGIQLKPGSDQEASDDLSVINPAVKLRARNLLIARRDHMLSLSFYTHTAFYIECLIVLEYLTSSTPLDSIISSFASHIDVFNGRLTSKSSFHELLHQSRAMLLYLHVLHKRPFAPSLVRSALVESVCLFPNNTIFLCIYAWNESRFGIDDRVRAVVNNVALARSGSQSDAANNQESIIPHVFAICTELSRGTTLGSNVHAIRGTFERAVSSDCGKSSAGLWKFYFMFEHSTGDLERAKRVLFRSIRACPWMKELYMLAFEHLRDAMTFEELKGVYDILVQKELRVHVSLDEAFEQMDGILGQKSD